MDCGKVRAAHVLREMSEGAGFGALLRGRGLGRHMGRWRKSSGHGSRLASSCTLPPVEAGRNLSFECCFSLEHHQTIEIMW